ncbi:phosphatidate phosphatase-like protein [Aphelenchoides avenae]|nr:phosphatidate phosphatase-like protein [Aphelenchus avenae]
MNLLIMLYAFLLHHHTECAVKIACYDCLVPFEENGLPGECTENKNCTGYWCFKGPNYEANAMEHSCVDNIPSDKQTVARKRGCCQGQLVLRKRRSTKRHDVWHWTALKDQSVTSGRRTRDLSLYRSVTAMEVRRFPRHFVSSVVCLPVLTGLKMLTDFVPYQKQGFFCDDDEIRHPNRPNTIESNTMLVMFGVVAAILIALTEYSLIKFLSRKGRRLHQEGRNMHPGVVNFLYFGFTVICSNLATSIACGLGKRTISRLRPNFISVCQPDLRDLCPPDSHSYVENYTCFGTDDEDEYFAFPSGHSAHAINFGVFLILYTHKRMKIPEAAKSFIHFFLFLLSLFICLSRVRDYKHRLSDVCGGVLLGGIFALFFVYYVMYNFRPNRYEVIESLGYSYIEGKAVIPTIVIDNVEKRAVVQKEENSGYGSLDDCDSCCQA